MSLKTRKELLVPSSWDNQYILTITGGKKIGDHWEVGLQYQLLGGAPFTPGDLENGSYVAVYDRVGRILPDYDQLNTERYDDFNRLNFRVTRKWYFERFSLDLYFDVQNALGFSVDDPPNYVIDPDANPPTFNDPVTGEERYHLLELENSQGTAIPSIGLILQF